MPFFFGKKKKKVQDGNTIDTMEKLRQTLEVLEKKEKVVQSKVADEVEKAKEFSKAKNKRAAIACLKKKKLYEVQVEHLCSFQLHIHDQMLTLDGATATKETMEALRTARDAMDAIQKSTNMKEVDKIMDELNDQMDNLNQIQRVLASPIADLDEDELEAELDELDGAELEEQLVKPAPRPAAELPRLPAQKLPLAAPQNSVEDEELAALQAQMVL